MAEDGENTVHALWQHQITFIHSLFSLDSPDLEINLFGSLVKFKNSEKNYFRKIIKYLFICSIDLNMPMHLLFTISETRRALKIYLVYFLMYKLIIFMASNCFPK